MHESVASQVRPRPSISPSPPSLASSTTRTGCVPPGQAAAQRWIDGATAEAVSAQEKVRSALIKPAVAEIGIQ